MKKITFVLVGLILSIVSFGPGLKLASASGESFSGTSSYSITRDDQIVFSDLKIEGSGNDVLQVNIFVPYGTLEMSQKNGLSFNSLETGNDLNFIGSRSNINAALATLKFTPSLISNQRGNVNLQINIGGPENAIYSPFTHHLYRPVSEMVTWQSAKEAAEASTFNWASGYLATITSQDEQDAVASLKTGGWLGASDLDSEGAWEWVGGPEAGQNFWNGGEGGTLSDGFYANWAGGMPDNYTGSNPAGENCLEIYGGSQSVWNDQNCDGFIVGSYIIEYGDADHLYNLPYKNIDISISAGKDLNNNGRDDITENNVRDLKDLEGNWVSIELGSSCTFSKAEIVRERDLADRDQEYNYPGGLIDFSASCPGPNSHTLVKIYYFGKDAEGITYKKYNPSTHQYAEFDRIATYNVTVHGQPAVLTGYNIEDGSPLDTDGSSSNGAFSDPVGVGVLGPEPADPDQNSGADNQSSSGSSSTGQDLAGTGQDQSFYILTTGLIFLAIFIVYAYNLKYINHNKKAKS